MIQIRNLIAIFLLIFLYNCGYSPIYNSVKNNDIKLNITSVSGDNSFNNQIKTYAKLYSNLNSKNEYEIVINSDYKKIAISKDSAGVTTNYKIIATVNFIVNINGKNKNINFQETIKLDNNQDTFKENTYEKNLQRNFASSIIKKLIIKILKDSDN